RSLWDRGPAPGRGPASMCRPDRPEVPSRFPFADFASLRFNPSLRTMTGAGRKGSSEVLTQQAARMLRIPVVATLAPLATAATGRESGSPGDDGSRGIWYYTQPSKDESRYKYSGGFATYPQQPLPIAVYAPKVNRTFFVYGGTVTGKHELLNMVAY